MSYPPPGQPPGTPGPGEPGQPGQPGYPSPGQQPPGYGYPPSGGQPPYGQAPQGWGQPPGPPRRGSNTGVIVAIVILLVVAAGGAAFFVLSSDDEDAASETPEGEEYVEALVSTTDDEFPVPEEDVRCLATAYVNELGLEGFEGKVTPQEIRDNPDQDLVDFGIEINEDQANGIYDRASDCGVDFREVAGAIFQGVGLSEDESTCMQEQLSDDDVRRAFITDITTDEGDDDDADEVFNAAAEECGIQS